MKKLLFMLLCALSVTSLNAHPNEKFYVYGIDYSYAKVYAANESVEQLAKAFENINMLIVTEPEKYDFSRIIGKRVHVVIEPMLKVLQSCDYHNLKSLNNTYKEPQYATIIKNYNIPQTEGIGVVIIAKLLDKPISTASYELITFDIKTREILSKKEVSGRAGGFGLRNYWATSVYNIIKTVRLY